MTDPRIHALLGDRQRLKRALPAILERAQGELPLYLEDLVRGWLEAIEDAQAYATGKTQQAIGAQRQPPVTRQRIEQRVKAVARHVLERHPELLDGGEA